MVLKIIKYYGFKQLVRTESFCLSNYDPSWAMDWEIHVQKKIQETDIDAIHSIEKVLVAQTTAEDYEVYEPFFLFFYNREIHRIGNAGNKSTALAISSEKGGFAGRTQD